MEHPFSYLGAFESYLGRQGYAKNTVPNYVSSARQFIAFLERAGKNAFSATEEDLLAFANHKASTGPKRHALNHVTHIRQYMRFLAFAESGSKPDASTRVTKLLSRSQKDALLNAASASCEPLGMRDRAFFAVVWEEGLKFSEALKLDLGQLDFGRSMLHFRDPPRSISLKTRSIFFLREYVEKARPALSPATEALFVGRHGRRVGRKGMWLRFGLLKSNAGMSDGIHLISQAMDKQR